ncbi:MAG: serine hydrolase [Patescibacteria group bacterium]
MKFQTLFLILILLFASLFINVDIGKYQKSSAIANIRIDDLKDNIDSSIAVNQPLTEISSDFPKIKCDAQINARGGLLKYINPPGQASENENIFELNIQKRWPIASLTKLMSSIISIEEIGINNAVDISQKAIDMEGMSGEFITGEIFRTNDLIKAMLMVSSNDATMALAEKIGEKKFVELMNKKAKELKMAETNFSEPTGLSYLNQSTSADLVKLANYIYFYHPEIFEMSAIKERKIFNLNSTTSKKLININQFTGENNFLGGKTGYISDETGRNLVAIFKKNDKIILTIILGAENAFEETKKMLECVK